MTNKERNELWRKLIADARRAGIAWAGHYRLVLIESFPSLDYIYEERENKADQLERALIGKGVLVDPDEDEDPSDPGPMHLAGSLLAGAKEEKHRRRWALVLEAREKIEHTHVEVELIGHLIRLWPEIKEGPSEAVIKKGRSENVFEDLIANDLDTTLHADRLARDRGYCLSWAEIIIRHDRLSRPGAWDVMCGEVDSVFPEKAPYFQVRPSFEKACDDKNNPIKVRTLHRKPRGSRDYPE